MRTQQEVVHAFTPNDKLDTVQKNCILKIQNNFKDLATDVIDLVPDSPDRTSALRKILEAKFNCIQAITHQISPREAPRGKDAKNA
jgi:hypothetical protein